MPKNKVQFNLKNVHYAIITETDSVVTWGTPVHVPGAVSLALDQQGEVSPFYADGIVYYQTSKNNGYSGDLEMALFPDEMLEAVWGYRRSETDQVLIENANTPAKSFALLYQIDGDADNRLYVLYNCTATRPGVGSATTTETTEPQTQTCTISAAPLDNGNILAKTTADTTETVKNGWFSKVYEEAAV